MDNEIEGRDFATSADEGFSVNENGQNPTSPDETLPQPHYRRLVTPDPAAFRYLEEDPSTTVLERRRRLHGYELFFVEQWGCSRKQPTFCITTFTGLEQHTIVVGVLSIPTDEKEWSPRLRVYLNAIAKYHARKRETPLGTLMVTNISGFPSALTVIPVPDGDLLKHREAFYVNENLKRMGCSGRAGINIAPPAAATQTKFVQTYLTSDQTTVQGAVVELVKLCQVALMFFDKLGPEYADGLLCDVTEVAINEWWSDFGSDIYNIDPSDGILGPTTVAALLGLLIGARNRLNAYGAPVAKDVFDIASTKRAIAYFQKSQKLERTRRLDRRTLDMLHKLTAKAASGEGWAVQRAVKSTVAELSGKGDILTQKGDKARIVEVETLDIETFVQSGSGDRFKWLWHGKPRKNNESEASNFAAVRDEDAWIFNGEQEGTIRSAPRKESLEDDSQSLRHTISDRVFPGHSHSSQTSIDNTDRDRALRKTVLKGISGKSYDARNGFGRIKDAVGRRGFRGHQSKYSVDDAYLSHEGSARNSEDLRRSLDMPFNASQLETYLTEVDGPKSSASASSDPLRPDGKPFDEAVPQKEASHKSSYSSLMDLETPALDSGPRSDYLDLIKTASGITGRTRKHEEAEEDLPQPQIIYDHQAVQRMTNFDWASSKQAPLRSTKSHSHLNDKITNAYWERRWPRNLSYTAMVDVVAASQPPQLTAEEDTLKSTDPNAAIAIEKSLTSQNRVMEARIQHVRDLEVPWIEAKIAHIEAYDQQCGRDQGKLDMVYQHKVEENQALQEASEELLSQEQAALVEANKDTETLGAKLEYELSALESKIGDVEDGVLEFERRVGIMEGRVREQLMEEGNGGKPRQGWVAWLFRMSV